jgi:hypothetical protein
MAVASFFTLISVAAAGRAVVAVASVGPGLAQQDAWRSAMRGRRAFIRCADDAARRARREVRGEVTADLAITAQGNVGEVTVTREAPDTPVELKDCFVSEIRRLTFPAPTGGVASTVTVQVEAVGTVARAKRR